jgi:hypothetical protein
LGSLWKTVEVLGERLRRQFVTARPFRGPAYGSQAPR